MLWALHDSDERLREDEGSFPVDREEAKELNQQGYGIYWTPNTFTGERRIIANLDRIRFWFCELDQGTKADQVRRLKRSPLLPTAVVESARGYHAYWAAKDATPETWKRIVRWGVIPKLGADIKVSDVLRILRAPGFNHVKDPKRPFQVRTVWKLGTQYTERQMMRAFPDTRPKEVVKERVPLEPGEGTFWQQVGRLDGRKALGQLSGHWLVKGERFRLEEMPNGNANIWRTHPSKYSTGCFIDKDGRFGNVQDGGSIAAWCKWYGWSWQEVASGLKEIFPELHDEERKEAQARQGAPEGAR